MISAGLRGARFDREQGFFQRHVHAEDAGQHPAHLQGIGLGSDGAGEFGGQLNAGVLQNTVGEVDNFAVQGFYFLGVGLGAGLGQREGSEGGAQVFGVFPCDISEMDTLRALDEKLEFVPGAVGSLDDGFGGDGVEVGWYGDLDRGIALCNDQHLFGLVGESRLDGRDRARAADGQWQQ